MDAEYKMMSVILIILLSLSGNLNNRHHTEINGRDLRTNIKSSSGHRQSLTHMAYGSILSHTQTMTGRNFKKRIQGTVSMRHLQSLSHMCHGSILPFLCHLLDVAKRNDCEKVVGNVISIPTRTRCGEECHVERLIV